jgi:hypothetical protein
VHTFLAVPRAPARRPLRQALGPHPRAVSCEDVGVPAGSDHGPKHDVQDERNGTARRLNPLSRRSRELVIDLPRGMRPWDEG